MVDDVISGVELDNVGMDVRVKHGDSRLHRPRVIRPWPAGPVSRPFVQYLIAFCSRPEADSDVRSGKFVRQTVKRNSTQRRRRYFGRFSNFDNADRK